MLITLSWIKEFLDTNASLQEISETLTAIGLEVDGIEDKAAALNSFIVAEITEAKPHPDADKLQCCKVNDGNGILDIVCGAPNARAGIKVVLAPVGAIVPANGMKIKQAKIRGAESCGMLCSGSELGISADGNGIIELPEHAKVGAPAAKALGLDDVVIDIAMTPNRGDCLGAYGIARDLAAAGLGELYSLDVKQLNPTGKSAIEMRIDAAEVAPLLIGCTIKNVKNGTSPAWLQQRLESIGQKSISTLVDITNYLTHAYGRPAHVYDTAKLQGNITARYAQKGETLTALDEVEYTLDESILVMADDAKPHAIAGVIGGLESGCDLETTDVFLEIAVFDPIAVAVNGRKLKIDSDARYRFERGVDHNFAVEGTKIAVDFITELCGGQASEFTIAGNETIKPRTMQYDAALPQKILGLDVSEARQKELLEALGFSIGPDWQLTIPTWRNDVALPADVVEEVARLEGYDAIPETALPTAPNVQALSPALAVQEDIRHSLAGRGLKELITYSFVSAQAATFFDAAENVTLENPISSDLSAMRPSLLPNLIQAIARNQARNVEHCGFFECGSLFESLSPEGCKPAIATVRCGAAHENHPSAQPQKADIFDAKADCFAIIDNYLPASRLQYDTDALPSYMHPARSSWLKLGKQKVALFGELHPAIAKKLDVTGRVVLSEIYIDNLPKPKAKKALRAQYTPSDLQASQRDFAFIVTQDMPVNTLLNAIAKADDKLIQNVSLFDVYEGEKVGKGNKSLAVSVALQPQDATLTDADIEAVSQRIIQAAEQKCQAKLRDA